LDFGGRDPVRGRIERPIPVSARGWMIGWTSRTSRRWNPGDWPNKDVDRDGAFDAQLDRGELLVILERE